MGNRIDDEADAWWARLNRPDGVLHRAAFEAWQDADPRHAAAFAQTERHYDIARNTRHRVLPRAVPRAKPQNAFRPHYALAGAVALVAVGTILWRPWDHVDQKPVAIATSAGSAVRAFRLADTSIVLLDANSAMTVDFNSRERRVTLLRGRARFIIAHDPVRRFAVFADGQTITAHGTVFDVSRTRAGARVVLISGVVDVTSTATPPDHPTGAVTMHAGQTLEASSGGIRATKTDVAGVAWPVSRLSFDGVPLGRVIALANRHAAVGIVLAPEGTAERRVSGVFDVRDTRALAHKLAAALDLRLSENGESIVLSAPR
jgi:transmembrane sensor